MLNFDEQKAGTVASMTQRALESYDIAIGSAATLTLSFIDAARSSHLTAQESQKLMQMLHESAGSVLEARAGIASAVSLMTSFKRRSNQAETDFGCPGQEPWLATAERIPLHAVAA